MRKIKFPVLDGKPAWPETKTCAVCGKHDTFPGIVLNFGALKKKSKNSYYRSKDLIGFFTLTWHDELTITVPIADNLPYGQADLSFCSMKCLRKFFNLCVDEFEKKIGNKLTK